MMHGFRLGFFGIALVSGLLASAGCGDSNSGSGGSTGGTGTVTGGTGGTGGTTTTKNACEQAAAEAFAAFSNCPDYNPPTGGSGGGGGSAPVQCSDQQGVQAQCLADCIKVAPCECLGLDESKTCSTADSQKYTDCVSACAN